MPLGWFPLPPSSSGTVDRASYIHPAVTVAFEAGTLRDDLTGPRMQGLEKALVRLLQRANGQT